MLDFITDPVADIPIILYVFWKHYTTLKVPIIEETRQHDSSGPLSTSADNSSFINYSGKSPQSSTKFVPYEIVREVKMNYMELTSSD